MSNCRITFEMEKNSRTYHYCCGCFDWINIEGKLIQLSRPVILSLLTCGIMIQKFLQMKTVTKKSTQLIPLLSCIILFSYGAAYSQQASPLDVGTIERVTGMKGKENKGEYKITVPQNDLQVVVDGFKIIPAMGLGSWAAFTPSSEGAMVMGDIILTENDLKPVQAEVIRQGLTISAIHNHFVRNRPNVMYMHIGGMGPTD